MLLGRALPVTTCDSRRGRRFAATRVLTANAVRWGVAAVATVCAGDQHRVYGTGFVSRWNAWGCSRTADAKLPCDRRATRLGSVLGLEPDDADDLAS